MKRKHEINQNNINDDSSDEESDRRSKRKKEKYSYSYSSSEEEEEKEEVSQAAQRNKELRNKRHDKRDKRDKPERRNHELKVPDIILQRIAEQINQPQQQEQQQQEQQQLRDVQLRQKSIAAEIIAIILKEKENTNNYHIVESNITDIENNTFKAFQVDINDLSLGPTFLNILVIPDVAAYDIESRQHMIKFSPINIYQTVIKAFKVNPNLSYQCVHHRGHLVIFFYGQQVKLETPKLPKDSDNNGLFSLMGNSLLSSAFNFVKNHFFGSSQ